MNANLDSAKNCILLTNPGSGSLNPTLMPFHLRRDGDEC